MKFSLEKTATLFFSIVAAALLIVLVIFYSSKQKIKATSDSVEHTQEVLHKSDNILLDVLNIETGSRGYLLTGNEIFLAPFNEAIATINNNIDELATLTIDNPKQQLRIDILKKAVLKKVVFNNETIELMKNHESKKAEKMISDGKGRILTEKIKSLLTDIKKEEFRLLKQRKSENEKNNKNSESTFLLLIVIIFVVLAIIIVILKNQEIKNKNAEKEKIAAELIKANFELGVQDEKNEIKASQYARSLIEASLDPLVTISTEGKITDVNDASVKVTGVPREKLIGTEFSNYFTEPEKAQNGYHQVFEKGFVADYPLTIKHTSGKLIDVLYNASVYTDDKGNVLGVFAAARDVTKQKQASQYARSLIEASLDPLVTISAEGRITDVNDASVKVTGVSREELIGTEFSNYFTEPEKAQNGYHQVFEKGFVADYPLTIKHTSGKLTDVLYNASVFKDSKGKILGVFAAARDVTEQKQASQYARSLIEASLDPLVTISAEGKITDVNDASVKVTGIPREELIGTEFSNYFTEPDKAQDGYRQVFEKGFVSDYPLTIKHTNGKLTDVLYNASVYKDNKGKILGVFAAARDVTEQKQAIELMITNKELVFQNEEKEKRAEELIIANSELKKAEDDIRILNEELEQKVIERTEQFQSVNKELEAFAYSISHDLRAPLRAINGFAKILKEDYLEKLDDDGMGSLNAILNNSKRMGQLIDDLLAFSRLGRKAVTTSEINMAVLVSSVKEEEMLGNLNNVEFVIHELLPAMGQQSLIKQVWVNLISNAIKYSKHKPKTTIEIGSYEKDNLVVYYVKDNGAGFDMQYYEKLFGVFQRLHSQEEFEGTGIGLAIVQKIIQRHNGTVWAESKLNEGTCFSFSLPGINS
ncbi:MAG: PAS domain S-box protein [Burkholderiales bacterium]|nr:PAS domain S-box protein [Bacteroidia bacterium]